MSRHLPSHLSHHSVSILSPPPEEYDADVTRLLNSEESMAYMTHSHSIHPSYASRKDPSDDIDLSSMTWTLDDVRRRREIQEEEHSSEKSWHCVATEDGVFTGVCSLRSIDWYNRSAEMGMSLLHDYWKHPIVAQAHFIVLQHAFEELRLHRISFCITDRNASMDSFCKNVLGASLEGTLNDYYMDKSGEFHNARLYAILEHHWPELKASLHRRIVCAAEKPKEHHTH